MSDKKKKRITAKKKRKQNIKNGVISPYNQLFTKRKYHYYQKLFDFTKKEQQRENDILRRMMQMSQIQVQIKMKQLGGNNSVSIKQKSCQLQKLKMQYSCILDNISQLHPLQKQHLFNRINQLYPQVQSYKQQLRCANPQKLTILQERTLKRLQKRLINLKNQIQQFNQNRQVLTKHKIIQQFIKRGFKQNQAIKKGQQLFEDLVKSGRIPNTQAVIDFLNQQKFKQITMNAYQRQLSYMQHIEQCFKKNQQYNPLTRIWIPTQNPVHPFPDFQSYNPQQYYDIPQNILLTGKYTRPYIPNQQLEHIEHQLNK